MGHIAVESVDGGGFRAAPLKRLGILMTKKQRFEVFKRDLFICQYCGATPPTAILEIDHIEPKSKGGGDDIDNLITACFPCNRGKGATQLKDRQPDPSHKSEVIREREDQLRAYNRLLLNKANRIRNDIEFINRHFESITDKKLSFTESFKNTTLRKFLEHLARQEICDALDIARCKVAPFDGRFINYFCGVCWRIIKRRMGDVK